jgi:DNA-binding MarR family transcriptional regulator
VDKLVRKKFLRRISSETDRRIVRVEITPKKGKDIYEQFMLFRHKLGEITLSAMDERDFDDMDRIMKKMVRQITDYNVETQLKKMVVQPVT